MTSVRLDCADRKALREWFIEFSAHESECWVAVKRGNPSCVSLSYIDAVEEALCFGWIDSIFRVEDGVTFQRFSPRRKGSPWTELNKERVRRLEALGLMTDAGRKVLPAMGPRSFKIDPDVESALKKGRAWTAFKRMPPLYQRVRAYNVAFLKKIDPQAYPAALERFVSETRRGRMVGQWNDYGRLDGNY